MGFAIIALKSTKGLGRYLFMVTTEHRLSSYKVRRNLILNVSMIQL